MKIPIFQPLGKKPLPLSCLVFFLPLHFIHLTVIFSANLELERIAFFVILYCQQVKKRNLAFPMLPALTYGDFTSFSLSLHYGSAC